MKSILCMGVLALYDTVTVLSLGPMSSLDACKHKFRQSCYFLKWKWKSLSRVRLFATPWTIPWNPPGQNTGVSSLSLPQGIFPTQESNWGLLHCRRILYQLSHKGSPRILEWVTYPFCSGSSQPRNPTGVSCMAGESFTNWAIREAIQSLYIISLLMV